nr:immunoglobulin heavy chain junction region [Macaca mulatta]
CARQNRFEYSAPIDYW